MSLLAVWAKVCQALFMETTNTVPVLPKPENYAKMVREVNS